MKITLKYSRRRGDYKVVRISGQIDNAAQAAELKELVPGIHLWISQVESLIERRFKVDIR